MIRIVMTGWCYYVFEGDKAKQWAHDISGWLMMPLALILVGLEVQLLSWVSPDNAEAEPDERKLLIPVLNSQGGPPKKTDKAEAGPDDRKLLIPLLTSQGGPPKKTTLPEPEL
jgi:hypothetical protein